MKDFLVLTCTLGNRDRLTNPPVVFDSCDYIAIVDDYHDASLWQQYKNYEFSSIDSYAHRRNAKLYKVLSSLLFPDYKYIVWHDANHHLIMDPVNIINEYGDSNDYYLIQHPHRICAYEEMNVVSGYLDSHDNIQLQRKFYQQNGFPVNYGLYALGCHIKKTNVKTTEFSLMWWEHICKFSSRDQCSFTYCLWDMGRRNKKLNYSVLNGKLEIPLRTNKYFVDAGTRK